MSYLQFHLLFLLPPLALLSWAVLRHPVPRVKFPLGGLLLMSVLAVVYTTPWDNYLIYKGVWGYGEDRVLTTLGFVPIEEYAFFILQPLFTGLWVYWLIQRRQNLPDAPGELLDEKPRAIGLLLIFAAGMAFLPGLFFDATFYISSIVVWAVPVLALQWWVGGPLLWRIRKFWLLAIGPPSLYLIAADAFAISVGTWHIAERYSLGWNLGVLPIEEAVFFIVTNIFVVQGLLLFHLVLAGVVHLPLPARAMRTTAG